MPAEKPPRPSVTNIQGEHPGMVQPPGSLQAVPGQRDILKWAERLPRPSSPMAANIAKLPELVCKP